MPATIVDRLFREFQALASVLERETEPSLLITADDTFRKVLLLSAASYFERMVTDAIIQFARASSNNERVGEFVRIKGLSRQYHTLFDWERQNANSFFGLFGETFKNAVGARLKDDPDLGAAIEAFLDLGRERNRLIHQDLGEFILEKTAAEIFAQYELATRFIAELPKLLASGS